jgi:ATP-binding cassette, subfamily B, bacterial
MTCIAAGAVIDGRLTLGAMLAIQYIIGQLNSPIEQMMGLIQGLQDTKISMDRLDEIQMLPDEDSPAYSSGAAITDFQFPGGSIDFENVTFTYPGAQAAQALQNISLTIPLGKTTAIVGMSGSGKTTLLKLLLKFYEVQSGVIAINGVPISCIRPGEWRGYCGGVLQESYIFSDTVAKNVAFGEGDIECSKLENALHLANATEFIEQLPLGYHTRIGAEGMGLSTGQKQRILIARVIYRNPELILFDEATNSLDANNEGQIVQNLSRLFDGKTVIVVAHRLSTVRNADQIVVMDNGRIVEKGGHEQLIRQKGKYYELVKNQLELDN